MTVFHLSTSLSIVHLLLVVGLSVRVIMRRPAPGVALAWLFLISAVPFGGAAAYLLVGERRVGRQRARRLRTMRADYRQLAKTLIDDRLTAVPWDRQPVEARGMDRLGRETVGVPTVTGSTGRLYDSTPEILAAIAADVDAAERSVLVEFYIWNEGGAADDVLAALVRAAERGVECRVLVDALGGRPWWKGRQPQRLREAGAQVRPALPTGLLRTIVGRNDLRLHRKIVVVDGRIAWTGSMNLVDPRYFKQGAGVGEWVDAMVRAEGAVVAPLAMTMIGDWMLETGEPVETIVRVAGLDAIEPKGAADVQVIPSGPSESGDGLLQMLLALINGAREELVLTTPYFVPDESMLRALRGAAGRGVGVDLIVPERVDSRLTRYASRSYYDDLIDAGIRIHLYRKGLLHTKSITADRAVAMFGTVNLDMRSLWLNYEVALFVYGREFAEKLRALQQQYLADSAPLDTTAWAARPARARFLESTLRLVSPIL